MAEYQDMQSTATGSGVTQTNKVLRNTYALLSMTLLFSAFTAGIAMMVGLSQGVALIMMFAAIGIMWFVLPRSINSGMGIVWTFVLTGLLGASLAPMLSAYVAAGMGGLVLQALAGTAIIFFSLSGYALVTRKDFSFMGGILFVGLMVVLVAMLANIFLQIPLLSMVMSGVIILIMSGLILFDTSRIIHGGETNYVRATVSLYMNVFNIFIHLLHLLGVMNDD
jgi:modulator of FtsH protease